MAHRALRSFVSFRLAAAIAALIGLLLVATPARAQPAQCRVGAYVTGLSPINFGDQEVHVDAYTWIRCPISVTPENMLLSVTGANEEDRGEVYTEDSASERYRYERIRATLRVPLSLRHYPFDTQRITLDLEGANATASDVRFVLDDDPVMRGSACCLDAGVNIPDWRVIRSRASAGVRAYPSRFGYTFGAQDAHAYPRFRVELTLQRQVRPYLWKVLLPLLIILAMALMSSFWPPDNLEATSNVLIASLLSVVAAHLTQRSELPNTGYLVTSDLFFVHAYLMLLLMLIVGTRAHLHDGAGRHEAARALQRRERVLVPVATALGWALVAALG